MNAHCKHHGYDESERIEQYFREKIALADAVLARSDTPPELRVLFHDALEKAKNMRIEEAEYETEATRSRYHQIEDVASASCRRGWSQEISRKCVMALPSPGT